MAAFYLNNKQPIDVNEQVVGKNVYLTLGSRLHIKDVSISGADTKQKCSKFLVNTEDDQHYFTKEILKDSNTNVEANLSSSHNSLNSLLSLKKEDTITCYNYFDY